MIDSDRFARFAEAIQQLPDTGKVDKGSIMNGKFLIKTESVSHRTAEAYLSMYYAPFHYVNEGATVVLVGITPGWTQAEAAFRAARDGLGMGLSSDEVVRRVKEAASFAGMRRRLGRWLDGIGLPEQLGLGSQGGEALFDDLASDGSPLHTMSVFRYPVFLGSNNYAGRTPRWDQSPMLRRWLIEETPQELNRLREARAIIPLGQVPAGALRRLGVEGLLDEQRCVFGLPHPSPANGHAERLYSERQDALRARIQECFR
jgi:hypothetical protein